LNPSMRVAITIYYGQCPSSADMTGHVGSRTDSYILSGDKTTDASFSGATVVAHWYTISAIDVLAPKNAAAVAVLGNSITDGYGLSGGKQNRWTDIFSERLLQNPTTQWVGVLNLGIGATNVASGTNSGLSRYKRDILGQSGVKWFIIFYGVNDINGGATANTIIDSYKKMAADAHANNIKVYCATITPFNGHSYYTPEHEKVRVAVNTWIRTNKDVIDGYIDFDKAVRDPQDTTRVRAEIKNDWLHPNEEGYKVLGQSVDLKLFETEVGSYNVYKIVSKDWKINHVNNTISFELLDEKDISLTLYSLDGKFVTGWTGKYRAGRNIIDLSKWNLSTGKFIYSLTTGGKFFICGNTIIRR
ncbi:MAG: SGNH/GDSL hydrolase family protein, partial [Chitinispirillaceae bacterium]|nr:SGNH/GDSL hydrolase family protein [Chitinispirillaceae bacterium]